METRQTKLVGLLLVGLLGPTRSALAQDETPPPESPPPPVEATVVEEPLVRGISWDIMAAGIPESGAIGQLELGFTGLPRLSYHYTLMPGMSLGGLVGFDYGTFVPGDVFGPNIIVGVPIRYAIYRDSSMSFAIRGDPALIFGFDPGLFAIQALVSAILGFHIENRFVIGAAIDLPITFAIHTGNERRSTGQLDKVFLAMPLLVGPVAEFHITPPFAVTLDAKFGPAFDTNTKIRFAMKIHAGAALRF